MYIPTIGLEIHIELKTKSKMFCSCLNDSSQTLPNVNVCPICMAHPGTLPVINKVAVKGVLKTALALNCEIAALSRFERKHYFYPDLPKGFQISQYALPMSKNGWLDLEGGKRIRIERIHLEEDTGKLLHPEGEDYSLVDFNRASVPLMELVTEPDIASSKEAKEFIKQLQLVLRYLNVSDADMERGQMRAEVNISLLPQSQNSDLKSQKLGTKVEIKNLNSIKSVEKSIEYEIKRQSEILSKGEKVQHETRGFHDTKQITFSQRAKEQAHDYRYFPEPDLPPLTFQEHYLQTIKAEIPELPFNKKQRLQKEYGLTETAADLFVLNVELGKYFEAVISELKSWLSARKPKIDFNSSEFQALVKLASNYITSDLQGLLKESATKLKISPENFAEFLTMIHLGEISSKIAKMVLLEMFEKGADPSQIIESKGLSQIGDLEAIEKIAKEIIAEHQGPANDYKAGKEASLQFLTGMLMQKTRGKANPKLAQDILRKLLNH